MPELRWILLIGGLVFVGALAIWEIRRQRRRPQQIEEVTQPRFREPTLGLPEIRPREAAQELPVLEIDDSMVGLRVDGVRIEEDFAAGEPRPAEPIVLDEPLVDDAPQPDFSVTPPEPVLAWPPEDQRRLITVRLMAEAGERFNGRALRLALAAEGFVHGKFSIFHKPGPDARVRVSAASVTQPGSFDLETMDTLRYGGLGLFIVLPGPAPASQLLEELLVTARNLGERLQGTLQDESGQPLDVQRIARMRSNVAGEAAT